MFSHITTQSAWNNLIRRSRNRYHWVDLLISLNLTFSPYGTFFHILWSRGLNIILLVSLILSFQRNQKEFLRRKISLAEECWRVDKEITLSLALNWNVKHPYSLVRVGQLIAGGFLFFTNHHFIQFNSIRILFK